MPTNHGARTPDARTVTIHDVFRFTSSRAGIPIWIIQANGVASTLFTARGREDGTCVTFGGLLDRDPFTAETCFMWPGTYCHRASTGTSRCKEMPGRSRRQPSAGRSLGTSTLHRTPIREAGGHTRGRSGCRAECARNRKARKNRAFRHLWGSRNNLSRYGVRNPVQATES